MKRRSWLWFIASAFLAILAGVLAIFILSRSIGGGDDIEPANTQNVVVALQAIARNTPIRADMVAVEPRDLAEIPSGVVLRVTEVQGLRPVRDIARGEILTMQDFTGAISGTLTRELDDKLAVALPADDVLSEWGAVAVGDHVDVLFTIDVVLETPMTPEEVVTGEAGQIFQRLERDQSLDNVSVLTLQNLEVLQIIEEPQPEVQPQQQQQQAPTLPRRALILKIDPQDAIVLKYLRDSEGTIDVALRSPENNALYDVEPVNINYLALRYGIELPQTLER
jgi:Flp pilus assembly protein CpaB